MIAQAIVALLQQASEIDRATVRSASLIARPPLTSSRVSGGSIFHAAEQSGGTQVSCLNLWPPYRRPSFSRHGQRARQAKKYLKGGPAARPGLYVLLPAASSSTQPSASSPASSGQSSPSCPASVSLYSKWAPRKCRIYLLSEGRFREGFSVRPRLHAHRELPS